MTLEREARLERLGCSRPEWVELFEVGQDLAELEMFEPCMLPILRELEELSALLETR